MDIYKKIDNIVFSTDLLDCAYHLLDFAEASLKEKNRIKIVNYFYQRAVSYEAYALMGTLLDLDKTKYYIFSGNQAVRKYLFLMLPKKDTPVKTLQNIRVFADDLIHTFTAPAGYHIDPEKVAKIMEYLDEKYSFSEKVFSDGAAFFLVFNVSSRDVDSHCVITGKEPKIIPYFLLYSNREVSKHISPEAVLFHELGHAIHARFTGHLDIIPEEILLFLKDLCFPDILSLSTSELCENFANILSIGLMHDSPFDEFDHFDYIHPDDKKMFKKLVEMILNKL